MKFLFLQKDIFVKPAFMLLSAVLQKAGHSCDLLIHDLEKEFMGKIRNSGADIIAFTITTGEYPWMNRIGKEIRSSFGGLIICGGAHPTFYPEVINDDYLDAVCVGEGDEALPDFADTLERGGDISAVQNFSVKNRGAVTANPVRPLVENLDALPYYDRSIYQKYALFRGEERTLLYYNAVATGRGCPYQCSFCFNKLYNELYAGKGSICRRRSAVSVIDEIQEMRRNDETLQFITFIDDVFTLPPGEWIADFLEKYEKAVGLPFKINTRANLLDEDLVRKLKKAGCYSIQIGVESGNEIIRNNIYDKGVSNEDIISASCLMRKHGIKFQTFNAIGAPGETLDMALATFDLNRRIKPDFVWCSLLNPYPGTDIFRYSVDRNCLDMDFDFKTIDHSYFTGTPVKLHRKKEMVNLQKLLNFGVRLRLSRKMMKLLIRLPLSGLYKIVFGAGFFLGLKKLNKSTWLLAGRLSITRFSRYNL